MKLLFAIGGGGHFSPALAVLEALSKDIKVLVVGRKYAFEGDSALSLEYQTLTARGVQFESITTGRLQRRLTRYTLSSLLKTPVGLVQSIRIIKKFKPDIIVSFGGYIGLPVSIAGFLLGIPVVLHEQTLGAGLSNRLAAAFARKICISFETSQHYFPRSKTVLTGNPVKKYQISNIKYQISNEAIPLILVMGGSGGSHAINVLVEGSLEKILEQYRLIHQTGDAKEFGDYDRLAVLRNSLPEKLQKRYVLTKFIDANDFGTLLKIANLVLSRSGINTVCQLLQFEKPSLLIPLPFAQKNEQLKNAEFLKNIGLAKVISQAQTTSESLYKDIDDIFQNINKYKISDQERKYLLKDATKNVINVILSFKK